MYSPFITTVTLKNYKSIASCKVQLGSLMFLVGRNGSGKSNFLDALKFVSDSLTSNIDHAIRDRGSIKEVRRRSGGHPTHFAIRLDFASQTGPNGHFSFRVGAKPNGEFEVQEEECDVWYIDSPLRDFYRINAGKVIACSLPYPPASMSDRLALVNFSGFDPFRLVFDSLSRIEIYNLNPEPISFPQKIDPLEQLRRDGSNSASILRNIAPDDLRLINEFISQIVPGVRRVETKPLGSFETLEFSQTVKGQKEPWRFLASSMSDGTLRAFGILLAIMQRTDTGPLLLGLEEPETAVHPAAARIIVRALRVGSERRQVLVTSHSPDLLDDPDIDDTSILSVENEDGITSIGTVDDASKKMLRSSLFTVGELLRQNQISIDPKATEHPLTEAQLKLFEVTPTEAG